MRTAEIWKKNYFLKTFLLLNRDDLINFLLYIGVSALLDGVTVLTFFFANTIPYR